MISMIAVDIQKNISEGDSWKLELSIIFFYN